MYLSERGKVGDSHSFIKNIFFGGAIFIANLAQLIIHECLRIIVIVITLFLQVRKDYAASITWACIRNLASSSSLEPTGVRPLR